MANTQKACPEAYPQEDPQYGYDQGPQPSISQAQVYSMTPTQKAYPEVFPQQNPQYGYDQGPPPSYNPASQGQVIVTQPSPAGNTVYVIPQPKPQSYLWLSIFVLLCCNLPLGIIALIFSVLSDSNYNGGDVEGAKAKGQAALTTNIISIVMGIILIIVFAILQYTHM